MSEFISFLPQPGQALANYDRSQPSSSQPDHVPRVFCDAMSVREEVFVEEQHVALENELDEDDPRSFHWVAYASVGTTDPPPEPVAKDVDGQSSTDRDSVIGHAEGEMKRKVSTANKLAIGTIRLVPPPHPPHPAPGSSHKIDNAEGVAPNADVGQHATKMHDENEPYIKLGRLSVLKPYRGLGLSNLLINAAISWAAQNSSTVFPPMSPAAAEQRRLELGDSAEIGNLWNGLILVHAQTTVEKVWARHGFVKDDSMGVWDEEGIDHIGMWRRIELLPEGRRPSVG